ncbi:hypothetical protein BV898_01996 [Hypsibius exemplaris]|uniref:Uncharacterized protein n=1 Tax=Hypsibius exemplaris TaxID=2072580 RepID=A0A1W0X9U9_HYPEX|nr:hypothetical protein BV898_01996 [Hypsibius exemplaris]
MASTAVAASITLAWLILQTLPGSCTAAPLLYVYDTESGMMTPLASQLGIPTVNGMRGLVQASRTGNTAASSIATGTLQGFGSDPRSPPSQHPPAGPVDGRTSDAGANGPVEQISDDPRGANRWGGNADEAGEGFWGSHGSDVQRGAPFWQGKMGANAATAVLLLPIGSRQPSWSTEAGGFDVDQSAAVQPPVSITIGTASGSQTPPASGSQSPLTAPPQAADSQPNGMGPGGPWDMSYVNDPAMMAMMLSGGPDQQQQQMQQQDGPFQQDPGMSQGMIQVHGPSGTRIIVQSGPFGAQQRSFDIDNYGGVGDYPPQYSGFLPTQLNNKATANVINSGSALQGAISANGKSNTQTGPLGASSVGHAGIGGSGLKVQGTSVNSAGSNSNGLAVPNMPPWMTAGGTGNPFGPSSGSANAMFVNSMVADKGTVSGTSDTLTHTGLGGNSFGSSSGSAMGQGQGIQLTQVANSDSEGSGFGGNSYNDMGGIGGGDPFGGMGGSPYDFMGRAGH